jgi:hypothetical protein
MKPLVSTNRKPLYAGLGALSVIVASGLFTLTTNGCNQGAEGDRCNPALVSASPMYNEDECGNVTLSCQQPMFCPESYCCPKTGKITSSFCMPGCPGGLDDGGAQAGCAAGVAADCAFLADGGP